MAVSFFKHDVNASEDTALIAVEMRYGLPGYAVYFKLLERLYGRGGVLGEDEIPAVAYQFRVEAETVTSILQDFGLFVNDGGAWHSKRVDAELASMAEARRAVRERVAQYRKRMSNAEHENGNDDVTGYNDVTDGLQTSYGKKREKKSSKRKEKRKDIDKDKDNNMGNDNENEQDGAPGVVVADNPVQRFERSFDNPTQAMADTVNPEHIEVLKSLGVDTASGKVIRALWEYADGVTDAIQCVKAKTERDGLSNPTGYFLAALKSGYKPPVAQMSRAEQKRKEAVEYVKELERMAAGN